ncbi:MAG: hypothetical protein MJ163_00440 [Alphaproteobacteria bacterium]|nr:hypothetical protein [Alphaproteobacteria bacterium]
MKLSREEKQQTQKERERVYKIIKYDVNRKYFGDWTPAGLNATYNTPSPISFYIGVLSVDKICDALWKEMSYNPERFGTVSPFKFNGQNSIDFFINQEIDLYDNDYEVLVMLQSYLLRFWNLALQYDKSLVVTNCLKNTNITISTHFSSNPNTKPTPNAAYIMLGCLRDSIHKIATQNIKDFGKAIYRDQIVDTVKSRYPQYFATTKTTGTNEKLKTHLSERQYLLDMIRDKEEEIMNTQSRIDTLNEFENPGDTSNDTALLNKQKEDLKNLETNLQLITQRIQKIKQQQYEH